MLRAGPGVGAGDMGDTGDTGDGGDGRGDAFHKQPVRPVMTFCFRSRVSDARGLSAKTDSLESDPAIGLAMYVRHGSQRRGQRSRLAHLAHQTQDSMIKLFENGLFVFPWSDASNTTSLLSALGRI